MVFIPLIKITILLENLEDEHTAHLIAMQQEKLEGLDYGKKLFIIFQLHKEKFLKHYHKRSNAETMSSAIKTNFSETLKSKNHTEQVNEMLCKIIAYNITVLIRRVYLKGCRPLVIFFVEQKFCTF